MNQDKQEITAIALKISYTYNRTLVNNVMLSMPLPKLYYISTVLLLLGDNKLGRTTYVPQCKLRQYTAVIEVLATAKKMEVRSCFILHLIIGYLTCIHILKIIIRAKK